MVSQHDIHLSRDSGGGVMAEYIEREALLRYLNDIWLTATPTDSIPDDDRQLAITRCTGLNDAMDAVKDAPAADVVPVVQCGECKHWERYDNTAGCGYCHKVKFEYGANGYVFNPVREPDFYCADGARMDGDGE